MIVVDDGDDRWRRRWKIDVSVMSVLKKIKKRSMIKFYDVDAVDDDDDPICVWFSCLICSLLL